MAEKKQTRRNKAKYPALEPKFNLKSRADLIDYDYIDKLSDKEKEFLNSFTEEFIGANLKHKGKKLHRSAKMKKDCYDRNNARNRDVLTKAAITGKKVYIEDAFSNEEEMNNKLSETLNLNNGSNDSDND